MKLKKLTIHNIASIEDAEIDFDRQPLSDADVFLISGDTGSGKTTILDAISLALYGDTPRFQSNRMDGKLLQGGDEYTLRNPTQLLRRNTGEGFVKLSFTGNNNKDYEAMWFVARARKKPDGRLQGKVWTLTADGSAPLDKDNEIKREIENAVGLDFTQFCRTSMLAQGEFSRFLNSKDEEKTAILEKITGTEHYREIGININRIFKEKKTLWEKARGEIEGLALLSEEELKEIKDSIDSLNAEYTAIEKEIKEEEAIIGCMVTLEKDRETLGRCDETLEKCKGEYIEVLSGLLYEENRKKTKENMLGEIAALLAGMEPRVLTLRNAPGVEKDLMQLVGSREAAAKCENKIKEEEIFLEELAPKLKEVEEGCKAAAQATAEALRLRDNMGAEVEKAGLKALREEAAKTDTRVEDIIKAQGLVAGYYDSASKAEKDRERIREIERELQIKEKEREEKLPLLEKARQEEARAREIYDGQKDTVDDFARQMRARLTEGDICPVCRQKILAPLESEDTLRKLIEGYKEKWDSTKSDLKKIEENINTWKGTIEALKKQIEKDSKDLAVLEAEVEKKKERATAMCLGLGVATEEDKREGLERVLSVAKGAKLNLEEKIKEGEKKETELKTLQSEYEKRLKEEGEARKSLLEVQQMMTGGKGRLEGAKTSLAREKEETARLETNVGELMTTGWKHDWKTATEEFRTELKEQATLYQNYTEQKSTLEVEIKDICKERDSVLVGQKTLLERMETWKEIRVSEGKECSGLNERMASLIAAVSETRKSMETAREEMRAMERQLEDIKQAHPERNNPDDTPQTIRERLEGKREALKTTGERRGALMQRIKDDTANRERKAEMIKTEEGLKKDYQKWGVLDHYLGSADGKKFSKVAQSYVLENLVEAANHYMGTLSGRYRLHTTPGTFIITVEDAYQGGAVRAAGTLSGGETFIVSLSLALALSDIGDRLGVDTLFIDEGFGSLSGDYLQSAVSTLRTLHSKTGRQVGIISHVEELRERIPVQIRVEQNPKSSSSTVSIVS